MQDLKFKLNPQLFGDEPKEPEPKEPEPKEPEPKEPNKEDQKRVSPQDLKDIKNNYVKKEDYNKLQDDYNKVVSDILDGRKPDDLSDVKSGGEVGEEIKSLRDELYGEKHDDLSNLQVAEKTLKLRKLIIDNGGNDPFLPSGHNAEGAIVEITEDDRKKANKVAEVLQHCVDYAEGDSEAFTTELMRLTVDAKPQPSGR